MPEGTILFRRVLVATESAPPRLADVLAVEGVIRGVEERGFAPGDVPPQARIVEGGGARLTRQAYQHSRPSRYASHHPDPGRAIAATRFAASD